MTVGISNSTNNSKYFTKPLMQSVANPVATQPAQSSQQPKTNNNKKIINAAIAVGVVSLIALAIFKGKSIAKSVSKLFKKEAKEVKPPQKPKLELPKPNFTCGEENAEQFAKEKVSYIDSIRKEYIDSIHMQHFGADLTELKEKNLLGLDALIKYGTREDMLKLSLEYGVSKDNDVMQKYCKLVRKVGEPEDSVKIFPKLGDRYTDIFDDTTKKEAMKTVKKLMVDDAPDGFNKNAEFSEYKTMEIYLTSKDPEMVDMAKTIMKRLSDENPWMLK